MGSEVAVQHDKEGHMFYVNDQLGRAYLSYMDLGKQTIDVYRTFVPETLRGKGLAAVLAAAAMKYAAEQGLTIIPSCSYMERYMERHSA